ncbi:hypothetical protein EDC44_12311 [Cricetibacter osteomyelitidis]|uniref:Inner membrane protein YedI n=1 Tax=Cricetibacter osteomyelitidis TaxID=1521931 RepID=A0A4R2SWF7_9PAST|nr:DUF808 domain-containing protein [Cricetibacter osteomyelitidis]TCP93211.1 hypothetical protein EDC44_12311 [Cricetibacter osteomyelitidis]
MAFASLFTLLDDITAVLDDVATMTKVAMKKTAGVVGDDLALNANQVTGVSAERELPIIWSVFKGSMLNKLILVPLSLLLSAFIPWLIVPLLMIGGAYLCFEGVEKLLHKFLHNNDGDEHATKVINENDKIRGAVRTDFILSAEIIILSLGVVADEPLVIQALVMSLIAVGMTVFVYGLVAGIVRLDDIGFWFIGKASNVAQSFGRGLIAFVPWFMRVLSFVGTLAMFLVGGGIIAHNLPFVHHLLEQYHLVNGILGQVATLVIGIIAGAIVCAIVLPLIKVFGKNKTTH